MVMALVVPAAASQWANPDVESLWQQAAAGIGHDRSSLTVTDGSSIRTAAAELLMQSESGQLELSARDRERLGLGSFTASGLYRGPSPVVRWSVRDHHW